MKIIDFLTYTEKFIEIHDKFIENEDNCGWMWKMTKLFHFAFLHDRYTIY